MTPRTIALLAGLVLVNSATPSNAFGGFGNDQSKLKGVFIAEVGDANEVDPPPGATWEDQLYSLNSRCFTLFGYYGYWGYGGKPAMLVIDQNKIIKLALFDSTYGSLEVKLFLAQMVQCPAHANIPPNCDDLTAEQCQKAMADHLKMLELKLKRKRPVWASIA